jgi:hypothetical protein
VDAEQWDVFGPRFPAAARMWVCLIEPRFENTSIACVACLDRLMTPHSCLHGAIGWSERSLVSGRTLGSGGGSPPLIQRPGTSTVEWSLMSCVAEVRSSKEGTSTISLATVSRISAMARMESGVGHPSPGDKSHPPWLTRLRLSLCRRGAPSSVKRGSRRQRCLQRILGAPHPPHVQGTAF